MCICIYYLLQMMHLLLEGTTLPQALNASGHVHKVASPTELTVPLILKFIVPTRTKTGIKLCVKDSVIPSTPKVSINTSTGTHNGIGPACRYVSLHLIPILQILCDAKYCQKYDQNILNKPNQRLC